MKDVAAQLPLSQQSPTSEEEAIDAIMHKQATEVNPETKHAKGDDLSTVLGEDDDDDKTPTSTKKPAELSPGKGGQSFGSG